MKNSILAVLATGLAAVFALQLSQVRAEGTPAAPATPQAASTSAPKQPHPAPEHKSAPVKQAKGAPTFGGYPCDSRDCAADKAGFRWAQDHGIADPDECSGNSGPFIEGCRVYAQRRANRT